MRTAAVVLGGILVVLGLIWVGQGLGYIKGSFMTGELVWAVIGSVLALLGVALIVGGAHGIHRRHPQR